MISVASNSLTKSLTPCLINHAGLNSRRVPAFALTAFHWETGAMATLTVFATMNYSAQTLVNITALSFTNAFNDATATFAAVQFGSQISNSLAVSTVGSFLADSHIVVNGSSVSAEGWTFINWGSGNSITMNGTSGADTLTGSSQRDLIDGGSSADIIRGGLGVDTLRGGAGVDAIVFSAPETASADSMDGGADIDTLQVIGSGAFDFHAFIINNIERLAFVTSAASVVTLDAGHIGGTGDILTFVGGASQDQLMITGSAINLSAVSFVDWTNGSDTVVIQASGGTVTGSNQIDDIRDIGQGAMAMNGGDGDDIFHYSGNSASATGDAIDGGSGTADSILLDTSGAAATVNLSGLASLTGVEILDFSDTLNCSATITDALIATGINTVDGGAAIDQLTMQVTALNGGFNADKLVFLNWTDAQDKLTILGNAGNNRLTGTGVSDIIAGGDGKDMIHGGAGGDTLDGGTGESDTLDYSGSSAVIVVLASNGASGGDAQSDVISNFENITGGSGSDILAGDASDNRLRGGSGADTLLGDEGLDRLEGGVGADRIAGGFGRDVLVGGGGSDIFIYTAVTDSLAGVPRDVITDFEQGTDKIDLSEIDAVAGGLDDAFIFRGTAGYGPLAGLRFVQKGSQTIIQGDVDGDRVADFVLTLDGLITLQAADFIL